MGKLDINDPHDHFIKWAMKDKRVSKPFFTQSLPKTVLQCIDLDTLKVCKETFIDEKLKLTMSDMLFSVNFGKSPGYLYLLVEHRSTPMRLLPFYVLRYMWSIMEKHIKETQAEDKKNALLPVVYPLIYYHGKRTPYPYSTDILDLFDDPQGLMPDMLFKPLPLVDVGQIPDEQLREETWSGIMNLAMKHIYARDFADFIELLTDLMQKLDNKQDGYYIEGVFNYIFNSADSPDMDKIWQVACRKLSKERGEAIMTIAERLKAEGEAQKSIEVAKKLLQKGNNPDFVAEVTGMPIEEVKKLH